MFSGLPFCFSHSSRISLAFSLCACQPLRVAPLRALLSRPGLARIQSVCLPALAGGPRQVVDPAAGRGFTGEPHQEPS